MGGGEFFDVFGDAEDGEHEFHGDAGGKDVEEEGDGAGDEGEEAVHDAVAEAAGHPGEGGEDGGEEAEAVEDADEAGGEEAFEGEVKQHGEQGASLAPDGTDPAVAARWGGGRLEGIGFGCHDGGCLGTGEGGSGGGSEGDLLDIHDGFAFFVEGLDDEALEAGGFDFEDAGVDVFPVLEAFGFGDGEGGFLAIEADFDLAAAVFGSAALGDGDAVATGFAGDELPLGEVGGVGPEPEAVFFSFGFVAHDFGPGGGGFGLQGDTAVIGEVDGFGAFFGGDEGDLFDVEHGGGAGGGGVHGEGGGVCGGEVDFTEVDLGG